MGEVIRTNLDRLHLLLTNHATEPSIDIAKQRHYFQMPTQPQIVTDESVLRMGTY